MANEIRPLAICVFRNEGRILVAHGTDPVNGAHFMRPLGGRIEFGELAAAALRREVREELHVEIDHPELLGVMENLFVYGGESNHEIVFVFDACFRDRSLYERQEIPIAEDIWDGPATWVPLDGLASGGAPLYPDGLLELVKHSGPTVPSR